MKWKRVGVLAGGISAEREVSLKGGRAIAAGLRRSGFDVVEIDMQRDVTKKLAAANVEAVYVALHGRWGEDGTVQGLLEIQGLPYTGSSVLASALAMDKILSRTLFADAGLAIPRGFPLHDGDEISLPEPFDVPVVVKPADEGSSFGISIVHERDQFAAAVDAAFTYSEHILVEEYLPGPEVTVAVLNGDVLGALEIEPHHDFYNYAAKYDTGGSTHHIPPRIPAERQSEVLEMAARAYDCIGCSSAARVDFIVPEGRPAALLEVNTIPGMTETSLLPEIAAAAGIEFDELVTKIMDAATLHIG